MGSGQRDSINLQTKVRKGHYHYSSIIDEYQVASKKKKKDQFQFEKNKIYNKIETAV